LESLERFRAEENNMSGIIPNEICNLNLQWENSIFFNLSDNMFCEPYPICIEGNEGFQDTSNCSELKSFMQESLYANLNIKGYPNPFNPSTAISFDLKEETNITVEIINLLGEKVNLLLAGNINSGLQIVKWDGKNSNGQKVSPGVYFCSVLTEYSHDVVKLIYLK